jgi:hypothetical protein
MVREAMKNLERADDFRLDVLAKRRREFYAKIADDTGRPFVRVAA